MGFFHQRLCLLLIQPGEIHIQGGLNAEPATQRTNAHLTGNGGFFRQGHLGLAGHQFQGAQETGRVTGGEQLLRIGSLAARTAQGLGGGEFDGQLAVIAGGAAITPPVAVAVASYNTFSRLIMLSFYVPSCDLLRHSIHTI